MRWTPCYAVSCQHLSHVRFCSCSVFVPVSCNTALLSFEEFSCKFLKLLPLRLPQCTRQPSRADFVLKAGVSVSVSAWQIHIFFVERQLSAKVKLNSNCMWQCSLMTVFLNRRHFLYDTLADIFKVCTQLFELSIGCQVLFLQTIITLHLKCF